MLYDKWPCACTIMDSIVYIIDNIIMIVKVDSDNYCTVQLTADDVQLHCLIIIIIIVEYLESNSVILKPD